ncbi:ribonuclease H-like protein [Trametes cingulata]|nr:ribonuclease H-like protein [Trametes cingulata]
MRTRISENRAARIDNDRITFNPSLTQDLPLSEVFRVFTTGDGCGAPALRPRRRFQVEEEAVEVYTDGSCTNNGTASAQAGSGVWFGCNDSRNQGVRVPTSTQSNQGGEIYAVTVAESKVPPFAPLHIVSDSKYVVDGLTLHLPKWEEAGWIGVKNADLFREAVAALRARSALTTFRWVKGHSRNEGNEEADRLAKQGAEQPRPYQPYSLPPNKRFLKDGASLRELTQSLAYKGIRATAVKHPRRSTMNNVLEVQRSVAAIVGVTHLEASIWAMLRRNPLQRKVRDFYWKALHGALRVGTFWENIPGYENRAVCNHCATTESVQHILTACTAPGQSLLWRLTRSALTKRNVHLPNMTMGLALGAHLLAFTDESGRQRAGVSRLARILVTETVYLIWALRCQRVVGWTDEPDRVHSTRELVNRWTATMNRRLRMDILSTNTKICGKKALSKELVLRTWRGTLTNEDTLPEDWVSCPRVLVGIPPGVEEPG